MSKVFMNAAGRKYLAEAAEAPTDSEVPFNSPDALTVLAASPRPLLQSELDEAIRLYRAGVPL